MRTLLLAVLLAPCLAVAKPGPEVTVAAFWRALSHAPGQSADVVRLRHLFHAEGVVFGSRERGGQPVLTRTTADAFIASLAEPEPEGFHECEVVRRVEVVGRFAQVYSVVESRRDPRATAPLFTGVNSLQLYRADDGWRIVSLYYHLPTAGEALPLEGGVSGRCLD